MTGAWIAVIDHGAGNLQSLGAALDRAGADWARVDDGSGLAGAAGIVLPGVGAAAPAARTLAARGLDRAILGAVAGGTPVLGICLGMQLLCERLSEGEPVAGLGLVPGSVVPLPPGIKRPHMGWNRIALAPAPREPGGRAWPGAALLDGWFYFAHSYAAECAPEHVLATVEYGGILPAAIGCGRAWGVQFHPEKSGPAGLSLLAEFWRRCAAPEPAVPDRP